MIGADWLARMEADHANLRAVLRYALDAGDTAAALRFGVALWRFWLARGHITEGCTSLEQVLAAQPHALPPSGQHAIILAGAAAIAAWQGDLARATTLAEQSLGVARRCDDPAGLWLALNQVGYVASLAGDFARGRVVLDEALALAHHYHAQDWTANALHMLAGNLWWSGDLDRAQPFAEASLALFRDLGAELGVGVALATLGGIAWGRGDYPTLYATVCEELHVVAASGDLASLGGTILRGAGLCVMAGRFAPAARLLGAAQAARDRLRATFTPIGEAKVAELRAELQARLGAEAFASTWSAGQSLSVDAIIAEVQALPPTLPSGTSPAAASLLSPRERDVLDLMAAGKSNAEIADVLVLSIRTVERHIAGIYGKLGLRGPAARAAAVAYAHEHGIAGA